MTTLKPDIITDDIADLFAAASVAGVSWTRAKNAKKKLKAVLFDEQGNRCAYCTRGIKDELGHYTIDHVLPKEERGGAHRWTSNDPRDRNCTAGYAAFTFTPHNLVLTCTLCNSNKGTWDARTDRTLDAKPDYVLDDENYYEWVHLYIHKHEDHIQLLEDLIYQPVGSSPKGLAVINTCKLDKIAAVEVLACEQKLKATTEVFEAFLEIADQRKYLAWGTIVGLIQQRFPDKAPEQIVEIGDLILNLLVKAG
ncbi:hypothetical protein U8P68_17225 [Rhizobium ruizarguesonis]|nr:hypothetical protein U8P68_17225 [Rhizobium ruizarguesonis]